MLSRLVPLAAVALAMALTAHAQPMGGLPGQAGMMRGGGARPAMAIADPAGYLMGLKSHLGITEAQEAAWDKYAAVVKNHADQMHAARTHMFEAMNTATWRERRDMMHGAMEERRQAHDAVRAAAEALVPSLSPTQKTEAARILPGLMAPARMMGR